MRKYTYLLFVIALIFVVFVGSYQFLLYNSSVYTGLLERHGSFERVENAGELHQAFIDYISSDSESRPTIEGYTDRELDHLYDVKRVIKGFYVAWWVALVVLIASFLFLMITAPSLLKMVRRLFLFGGMGILGMGLVFILGALLFVPLFYVFHTLFFASGTWVFSSQDLLIRMYPLNFFRDYFIRIIIDSVLVGLVFVFIGWLLTFIKQNTSSKLYS
tara:strand:- start:244 stop:894 length:651 start_codon:yes stop_codon:yes gene_type:complete